MEYRNIEVIVCRVDICSLFFDCVLIECAGNRGLWPMIGNEDLFVVSLGCGLGHLTDTMGPIGVVGMHLQVAAYVAGLEQVREFSCRCGGDFAGVLEVPGEST